jgi:hypothetical protein
MALICLNTLHMFWISCRYYSLIKIQQNMATYNLFINTVRISFTYNVSSLLIFSWDVVPSSVLTNLKFPTIQGNAHCSDVSSPLYMLYCIPTYFKKVEFIVIIRPWPTHNRREWKIVLWISENFDLLRMEEKIRNLLFENHVQYSFNYGIRNVADIIWK